MNSAYQVKFFNELCNSYGKPFKPCQRTIVITAARTPARAVEAAKRRFARLEHIRDWRQRAQGFEVVEVRGG